MSREKAKEIFESLSEEEQKILSPGNALFKNDNALFIVGDENCFVEVVKHFKEKNTAYINIGVRSNARGQGLGQRFVMEAVENMRSFGIEKMMYIASKENTNSCHLAQKLKDFKEVENYNEEKRCWIFSLEPSTQKLKL